MNITYEDKVALIENEDIPDINKCNASDMNQIKEVVNSKANVIKLLTVNDVAPVNCETGDKYYNTADEVIYTAVGTNEWGTDGKLPIQGYVYLDVENSKLYCYDGTIFSSYGGGTSNEIVISEEQPTTEDWKIWINPDEPINNIGSEVVDTLEGNETNKAPSVRAVNNALNNKPNIKSSYSSSKTDTYSCEYSNNAFMPKSARVGITDMNSADACRVGIYTGNNVDNAPTTGYVTWLTLAHDNNSTYCTQICAVLGSAQLYVRYRRENSFGSWNTLIK